MKEAFVLLNCDFGKELQVLHDLILLDNVKEAHSIFGSFDVIAKLGADSEHELKNTIKLNILSIKQVTRVLTLHSTHPWLKIGST